MYIIFIDLTYRIIEKILNEVHKLYYKMIFFLGSDCEYS